MSAVDFYGDAASVVIRTGIEPSDLGLDQESDPETALTAFIEDVLTQVSDLMDRLMRTDYREADPIPPGLMGIADDATADSLRVMVSTRQTPIVRIDDFAVRTIQSAVLSPDVKDRLKLYSAGRGLVSVDIGQDMLAPLPDVLTPAMVEDIG